MRKEKGDFFLSFVASRSSLVACIRWLSLSSFLSSESRSNAVTELVEVPSIDYAESQKKY